MTSSAALSSAGNRTGSPASKYGSFSVTADQTLMPEPQFGCKTTRNPMSKASALPCASRLSRFECNQPPTTSASGFKYAVEVPAVQFLATRDGETALKLPPVELTPDRTSLKGLRKAFFEGTGGRAFVLHDGGIALGLEKDRYLVRLEGAVSAPNVYPPLEQARVWQQPGWFRKTLSWLTATLGETLSTVEQVSTNDLACVMRVQTEGRTVYLKASQTRLEAALTAQLATRHPDLTPNVVAWDADRRLLVTEGCGTRFSESAEQADWHTAVTKLARFQRMASAHSFRALGCPLHTFDDLASRAETFLHDVRTLRGWGLTAEQVAALAERVLHIRQAHERVLALNLPPLPAHGDAHPINALTGCGVVWLDLSEACVAHPLLDIGWFLAWFSHPSRTTLPLRQTHPDAEAELWRSYLHASDLPEATDLLRDVKVLALTHRVLVYHEQFYTWQGTVPGWRTEYVPYYLRCLLKLPL